MLLVLTIALAFVALHAAAVTAFIVGSATGRHTE